MGPRIPGRVVLTGTGPDNADGPSMFDDRFLNRELSWLSFNERVLALASEPGIPLLERAKFCAISCTNLDEFFQVRVAALKDQVEAGIDRPTPDGRTPVQQLDAIGERVLSLVAELDAAFVDRLVPELRAAGVDIISWDDTTTDERKELDGWFEERGFPVLTPLAVDPGHPFPYISDLALSLAVNVSDPETGDRRFARLKVPRLFPRLVEVSPGRFLPVEQLIAARLDRLFVGMIIEDWAPFRVSRNADLTLEEEEADDLLEAVEMELRRRRFNKAVRLEVSDDIGGEVLELLVRELELTMDDVTFHRSPLDLSCLWELHDLERPDLKDEAWPAVTGGHASSLRSGRSRSCSSHRQLRSSGDRWNVTSSMVSSSSRTSSSSTSPPMSSDTSRRTALLKRRRRNSISTASSRSSASSSSRVRSALRLTRNGAQSSMIMPTNSRSRRAAISCSTGRNRPGDTSTSRGKRRGTLSRANRRSPVSGSETLTASDRARSEMYGNGCPGSTANGVSTGNTRSSNHPSSSLRSSVVVSSQEMMSTPAARSSGTRRSTKVASSSVTNDNTRSPMASSCCTGVRPSGVGRSMPASTWSLSAATRTWKNSSRLVQAMAQNLARSSRGMPGSDASASTRSLNDSQLSSRLRKRSSNIEVPPVPVRTTRRGTRDPTRA